jgi:hypothetical protein
MFLITTLKFYFLQIMFVQRVIDLLASRPDKMDQDAVLTALTNWNGPPLPLYIFPPHIVQNGWQVFRFPWSCHPTFSLILFAVFRAQGECRLLLFPLFFDLNIACRSVLLQASSPS